MESQRLSDAELQSLNPYSYIMNNPLAARDPSGYAVETPEEDKPDPAPKPEEKGPKSPRWEDWTKTGTSSGGQTYSSQRQLAAWSASKSFGVYNTQNGRQGGQPLGGNGAAQQTPRVEAERVAGDIESPSRAASGSLSGSVVGLWFQTHDREEQKSNDDPIEPQALARMLEAVKFDPETAMAYQDVGRLYYAGIVRKFEGATGIRDASGAPQANLGPLRPYATASYRFGLIVSLAVDVSQTRGKTSVFIGIGPGAGASWNFHSGLGAGSPDGLTVKVSASGGFGGVGRGSWTMYSNGVSAYKAGFGAGSGASGSLAAGWTFSIKNDDF